MFSGPATVAAFILMFLPVFAFDALEKRRRIATLRLLAKIGFVTALYCVAVGIALLAGWADSASAADDRSTLSARTLHYWPYGLIAAGGFWTVVYGATAWKKAPTTGSAIKPRG